MDTMIVSALIALAGSLIGTFAGIITSTKLVNYKIEELQKQVEKHNNLIERTYDCEQKLAVHEEQIKVINHRIADLESEKCE